MFWFCSGHFAATWFVCLSLIFRFHASTDHPTGFILFALLFWPVVLELLPLKGYFYLKRVTLDRLKARVHRGELKKAVVFGFGFCTSLFAAVGIQTAVWAVGSMDFWFGKMDGWSSALHTLAWFPVTFLLWVVPPVAAVAMLAGKSAAPAAKSARRDQEPVNA